MSLALSNSAAQDAVTTYLSQLKIPLALAQIKRNQIKRTIDLESQTPCAREGRAGWYHRLPILHLEISLPLCLLQMQLNPASFDPRRETCRLLHMSNQLRWRCARRRLLPPAMSLPNSFWSFSITSGRTSWPTWVLNCEASNAPWGAPVDLWCESMESSSGSVMPAILAKFGQRL